MSDDREFEVVDECMGDDEVEIVGTKENQPSIAAKENVGIGNKETAGREGNGGNAINDKQAASLLSNVNPAKGDQSSSTVPATENVRANGNDGSLNNEVIQLDSVSSVGEREPEETLVLEVADGNEKTDTAGVDTAVEKEAVVTVLPEHAWYEEKIKSKENTVRERLSKLSRVLEFSYPAYKPWLEHNKDPVCHLDPVRRCPLDRPHTNRWKFICSRKPSQESTNMDEDSGEGTVNKKVETVWRLGPTDGSGVNTDNATQYPPFVMRVVKVFEEFIQSIAADILANPEAESEPAKEQQVSDPVTKPAEPKADDAEANDEEATQEETANNGTVVVGNHIWLWLLVRSNSKDELMVFATGKKISRATMDKLKETFESGAGKDCNVKSLYCKSIGTIENPAVTNTTFLFGSEALDETVGGLKIQLAPKTNFWCNASGAEQLGATVGDLLSPMSKTTVVEVGCGLGLIGLMLAPKCRQVIGLDAPSEIEEAEMTSELNKIKNSTFIMGLPDEVMVKVTKLLKSTKACAIVNANTKMGRAIEVMTALRKIPSLRRIVMITTLTKQSVRAILELTRPADADIGNPFMPVRAVLVDTLPVGPHFEVVIRMERLVMQKIGEPWFWNHVQFRAGLAPQTQQTQNKTDKPAAANQAKALSKKTGVKGNANQKQLSPSANKRANNRANKRNKMKRQKIAGQGVVVGSRVVVGPGLVTGVVKNASQDLGGSPKNPLTGAKNVPKNPTRASGRGKRSHSPDKSSPGSKRLTRSKPGAKPQQPGKSTPPGANSQQPKRTNPQSPSKKGHVARPSGARGPQNATNQNRKRQWGTDAMRGPVEPKRMRDNGNPDLRNRLGNRRIDPVLMQQVQKQQMLLNMAQQHLGHQGPMVDVDTAQQLHNMLNIVLEQTNKIQSQLPRSVWDRIEPAGNALFPTPSQNPQRDQGMFRDRFNQNMGPQDSNVNSSNLDFGRSNQGPMPLFPGNRPPLDHQPMPAGMSPRETLPRASNTRGRQIQDRNQGKDYRNNQAQGNNWNQQNQYEKNRGSQTSVVNKPPILSSRPEVAPRLPSPKRALPSPPKRLMSQFSAQSSDMRRPVSPPRRPVSPPRSTPVRSSGSSEIFQRRPAATQSTRQQQQVSDVQRRGLSPPRHQSAAARPTTPVRRFMEDWDMSNRSTQERGSWNQSQSSLQQQQRSGDRNVPDKRWSNDRSQSSSSWAHSTPNDLYRKNDGKDGTWVGSGGDNWNSKQMSAKSGNWSQGQMEKQWGSSAGQRSNDDVWNSGGKGGYDQQSNTRMDSWSGQNKSGGGKDDWNDLPEDARDPWGDDGGVVSKSRWQQNDKTSGSNWGRDNNDKMDQNWSNKSIGGSGSGGGGGNWQQNKNSAITGNKPQWPNMDNLNSNEQRWMSQNDASKNSGSSNNWQLGNSNTGNNWGLQNFSGYSQQQRQNNYGSNNYKGGR